jgi:hypothetical protein
MSASASYNSAQIAEARSQTRWFGHDNALPQGSAETSFQHPFEHPESHQTGDLCSIPLPCNGKGRLRHSDGFATFV